MDAAAEAETRGWKMSQEVTAEHLKLMADKGMRSAAPDAKFRAELEPIGDTLTAEWLKKAGPPASRSSPPIVSSSRPLSIDGAARGGGRAERGQHA